MGDEGRKPSYDESAATVKRLEARIPEQDARIVAQDQRIAELEGQLAAARKNSLNSSKLPSSDITKPPADPARSVTRRPGS